MNVLLINPPFYRVYKGFEQAARIGANYPPTGLLYLAGELLRSKHHVKIIDLAVEPLTCSDIISHIKKENYRLVGITATTPVFSQAEKIARHIKRNSPIPIAIGGIHATVLGKTILQNYPCFDFVIIGEGELCFSELANCLENGLEVKSIPGLIYRHPKSGKPEMTARRCLLQNLDRLPFQARQIINKNHYLWVPPQQKKVPIASIITQRGCPFHCVFCSQHLLFSHHVRERSIVNVLDEIDEIINAFGIRHIMILDDTFVLRKERVLQFCAGIRKRGLVFTWENMSRADLVDQETIEVMKDAGLVRISFGIESGDQKILDSSHKGTKLDQIRNVYIWAKKAGIETRGSAIIGHPNETAKSAWKTIWFLFKLKELKQVYLNIMVPYPGTEVYKMAVRSEAGYRLLSTDYNQYIRYNDAVLEVNNLNRKKLKHLQIMGLLLFYSRPNRIFYNLFRSGIWNGSKMALAMIKGLIKSIFSRQVQ